MAESRSPRQPNKPDNNELWSWIVIALLFAFAWPVGLIVLFAKLSDRSKRKKNRAGAQQTIITAEPEDAVPAWEEQPDELVRVKRFAVKPMAVEDAIAQMDMLGHSFFVFINAETGITSVIYRRADGKLGMIEPIQG